MAYDPSKAAEEVANAMATRRASQEASDRALEEFFARGGVVQVVGNNVSGRVEGSSYSAWGKPKKKAAAVVEDDAAPTEELVDEVDVDEEIDPDTELE